MAAIVVGNSLVVLAISVDRRLKGVQHWFIGSLAVSDLLVGLFIMPLSLANELMGFWAFGDIICQLWLSTDVLLCTASILNLCLISLDHFIRVSESRLHECHLNLTESLRSFRFTNCVILNAILYT